MSETFDLIEQDCTLATPAVITLVASSSLAGAFHHPRLKEFTFFPKLPIELRFKIWKDSFPGPRYVEIRSTAVLEDDGEYDTDFTTWRPLCIERAPVVFFVCREARAEVVKQYKPFRGTERGSTTVWCDFSKDYFCFMHPRCTFCLGQIRESLPKEVWNAIKRVIIEQWTFKADLGCMHKFHLRKSQLKELVILPSRAKIGRDDPLIKGFEDISDNEEELDLSIGVCKAFYASHIRTMAMMYPEWKPPLLRVGRLCLSE